MSEWVKVSEKLPEKNVEVLCWCGYWLLAELQQYSDGELYFEEVFECRLFSVDMIEYWMPLTNPNENALK